MVVSSWCHIWSKRPSSNVQTYPAAGWVGPGVGASWCTRQNSLSKNIFIHVSHEQSSLIIAGMFINIWRQNANVCSTPAANKNANTVQNCTTSFRCFYKMHHQPHSLALRVTVLTDEGSTAPCAEHMCPAFTLQALNPFLPRLAVDKAVAADQTEDTIVVIGIWFFLLSEQPFACLYLWLKFLAFLMCPAVGFSSSSCCPVFLFFFGSAHPEPPLQVCQSVSLSSVDKWTTVKHSPY